jgi:hypothetical protein
MVIFEYRLPHPPAARSCDTSPMESDYKFGTPDPEDRQFKYPNLWAAEKTSDGGSRLVIAPETDHVELMIRLLSAMSGPFWLLYVLVVNRGGGELGRYQSPEPQTTEDAGAFLKDFSAFLEKDGRHDLWIASASSSEMLIYDRHNVIYAYGSLSEWQIVLSDMRFSEVPLIRFPSPHSHHYHQSMDDEELRMVGYWNWNRTPLMSSDEE